MKQHNVILDALALVAFAFLVGGLVGALLVLDALDWLGFYGR